jgi:hypothetical protein
VPRTFTVYHCGTGFTRDNTTETIANLATRTVGGENRDWMITPGPGSRGNPVKRIQGVVTGQGWDENVASVMEAIKADPSSPPIGTVNMAGWSRGAITCHMTAHALANDPQTRHLRVNIFAIDPVPGPGNFDDDNKITLPANVDYYIGIIMEDEARKIMRPAELSPAMGAATTNFTFHAMPGQHGTGVFRTQTEIGLIVAGLAHQFLSEHGTVLKEPIDLTPLQYCELYSKVLLTLGDYRKLQGSPLRLLGTYRRQVTNEAADTGFFVNHHHARQFQIAFPAICDLARTGADEKELREACDKYLSAVAPTTYQFMTGTGVAILAADDGAAPQAPTGAAA